MRSHLAPRRRRSTSCAVRAGSAAPPPGMKYRGIPSRTPPPESYPPLLLSTRFCALAELAQSPKILLGGAPFGLRRTIHGTPRSLGASRAPRSDAERPRSAAERCGAPRSARSARSQSAAERPESSRKLSRAPPPRNLTKPRYCCSKWIGEPALRCLSHTSPLFSEACWGDKGRGGIRLGIPL